MSETWHLAASMYQCHLCGKAFSVPIEWKYWKHSCHGWLSPSFSGVVQLDENGQEIEPPKEGEK